MATTSDEGSGKGNEERSEGGGHPKLETRRSSQETRRTRQTAGVAGKAFGVSGSKADAAVPAIYRIERAAIYLRRLRWKELNEMPSGKTDASAAAKPLSPELLRELLDLYARPVGESRSESQSSVRRFGMRLRSALGMVGGRKPQP
jgi:hypothetical protein